MNQPMLRVSDLHVHYGGIQAVKGVSFEVFAGELVSLIGSNGAGKTTTMKAITGLLTASAGRIELNAKPIHQSKPWDLVKQGLAMVPEGRGVFTRMTIVENLQMGAYSRIDGADLDEDMDRIFSTFPRLKERSHQLAGTLSGGEQQMLAMGRALIQEVAAQGVTIVLVEQNASRALQIAQRAYVMESGVITLSGKASDLLHDPKVRAAYLGE